MRIPDAAGTGRATRPRAEVTVPAFLPGAELCRDFHAAVIRPALADIPHAAGLLGPGSDVLGYDTTRSTDHDWGPRGAVFVAAADVSRARTRIAAALPDTFRGWPVRIGRDHGPFTHHVTVDTWPDWLEGQLGGPPPPPDDFPAWLALPQQKLLEVVAGPVFADPGGVLAATRAVLAWYPDQVWWWLMACQWHRLADQEPFVQRAAEVGDELGRRLIAARQVRELVRLALLQARRYAPYPKWLGSAFARLDHPDGLDAHLDRALRADEPEPALAAAATTVAIRHAGLVGAGAPDPSVRPFWDRPALVLDADRFTADCLARVGDPVLRRLPLLGGIDQLSDSTDLLVGPGRRRRRLYDVDD